MWPTNATGVGTVHLEEEATPICRWQSRHRCLMRSSGWTGVLEAVLEGKAEATTAAPEDSEAEGQRRDLSESASGCRRRSRRSGPCRPKEGAAGQRTSESSLKPLDQFGRIERR
jgi:hypothetical protein